MPTEHSIIFSTEMVRAILDNRKSQTRRIIKPQPFRDEGEKQWVYRYPSRKKECLKFPDATSALKDICPYGRVGDTLWVREAFRVPNMDIDREQSLMVHYYSDWSYKSVVMTVAEMKLWKARKKPFSKTSGRFMYKSLARIFLEITNIRVERVQDINLADIKAEGLSIDKKFQETKDAWIKLWDSINAKRGYGWDKNSWCWVIEFKKGNDA